MAGPSGSGTDGSSCQDRTSQWLVTRLAHPLSLGERDRIERELVRRWLGPLVDHLEHRFAALPRADAEEVGLESIRVMLEDPFLYDRERGAPETLLRVIGERRALKRHRRARRRPDTVPLESVHSGRDGIMPVDTGTGTDDREDEEARRVRRAMKELPPRPREVVDLHARGLTHQEIADVLGCSPGAVRVALHRGLRRLRGLLS